MEEHKKVGEKKKSRMGGCGEKKRGVKLKQRESERSRLREMKRAMEKVAVR